MASHDELDELFEKFNSVRANYKGFVEEIVKENQKLKLENAVQKHVIHHGFHRNNCLNIRVSKEQLEQLFFEDEMLDGKHFTDTEWNAIRCFWEKEGMETDLSQFDYDMVETAFKAVGAPFAIIYRNIRTKTRRVYEVRIANSKMDGKLTTVEDIFNAFREKHPELFEPKNVHSQSPEQYEETKYEFWRFAFPTFCYPNEPDYEFGMGRQICHGDAIELFWTSDLEHTLMQEALDILDRNNARFIHEPVVDDMVQDLAEEIWKGDVAFRDTGRYITRWVKLHLNITVKLIAIEVPKGMCPNKDFVFQSCDTVLDLKSEIIDHYGIELDQPDMKAIWKEKEMVLDDDQTFEDVGMKFGDAITIEVMAKGYGGGAKRKLQDRMGDALNLVSKNEANVSPDNQFMPLLMKLHTDVHSGVNVFEQFLKVIPEHLVEKLSETWYGTEQTNADRLVEIIWNCLSSEYANIQKAEKDANEARKAITSLLSFACLRQFPDANGSNCEHETFQAMIDKKMEDFEREKEIERRVNERLQQQNVKMDDEDL